MWVESIVCNISVVFLGHSVERRKLPQQENGFGAFWARKNASDDNEFGIGIRPVGIKFVNMWRYITFKVDKIGTWFGIWDNSASRETS